MREYLRVALLSPPFSSLTYALPEGFGPDDFSSGQRVLVPLGRSLRLGVVLGPEADAPPGVEIKPLVWPVETRPLLDADALALTASLAARQMVEPGRILGSVLPRGLRSAKIVFERDPPARPRSLAATVLAGLSPDARIEALALWRAGAMRERRGGLAEPAWTVTAGPPWPLRPGATKLARLLDHVHDHGPLPLSTLRQALGPETGRLVARLAELGLLTRSASDQADAVEDRDGQAGPIGGRLQAEPAQGRSPERAGEDPPWPPLTEAQGRAVAAFLPALAGRAGRGESRLLFGVTGSGKTRVYLELVRECLAGDRSALLLAPEVALATRLYRAARGAFPDRRVILYHGSLSPTAREAIFRDLAATREPRLLVGARSALFLPLPRPGLIVMDEEHDASFKQEERLPYQAKEVAHFRARRAGALLLLGSATPDVKTFHASRLGLLPCVDLPERVGRGILPELTVIDMRGLVKVTARPGLVETGDWRGVLTTAAADELRETVARGEQAIILLNRRGYAPLLYCPECEATLKCPDCELAYTYHKDRERLVCHYCGHTREFPAPCPGCGGGSYLPLGVGAELLEEQLAGVLPTGARVARLDRDAARRPGQAEAILADFASGRTSVLVGTQMLSKGHHFPSVTLVVVADGDLGRNLPDYRAAERTFQLLVQASGRAGRGDLPGRVLLQTRAPADPFWDLVRRADYQGFYASELPKREKYRYPPYCKLALVRLSHPRDMDGGAAVVAAWAGALRRAAAELGGASMGASASMGNGIDRGRAGHSAGGEGAGRVDARGGAVAESGGVVVRGPAPAPLRLIGGRVRYQALLKADDWPAIRRVHAAARAALAAFADIRLELDLDPVDML